jgi:hypothetical protein
LTNGAVDWA